MPKRAYSERDETPGSIAGFIDDQAELSGSDVAEDPEDADIQAPKRRKQWVTAYFFLDVQQNNYSTCTPRDTL